MTLQGSQVPKRPPCPASPPGGAGWSRPQGRGGEKGHGSPGVRAMQHCRGALGPTRPAPTEGRRWGRAGRANPHPASVSAPRPAPTGDLEEVSRKLAGSATCRSPDPPRQPQTSLQPPKRRRAHLRPGWPALTHRAAGHAGAAGGLPPPGWPPGVSTELRCPLGGGAVGGGVGWCAQLTPRTPAAPSTGSFWRGPCRSGAGGVSR